MQVGAEDEVLGTDSEGGIHAEMKIGDSTLMMGGGRATPRAGSQCRIARRARRPARTATVKGAGGNHWCSVTSEERPSQGTTASARN